MKTLKDFYKNKIILVTGGAGSIGKETVKKLLELKPKTVRILDINETGLFELEQELNSKKIRLFIGDIRDRERLKRAVEGVDIIFHTAALKHVSLCEYNPFEAVKTNVIGTQNLINVAIEEEVKKFLTISTDKAVNPANVMGATKLLAERLTIAANLHRGKRKTIFSCVRFGNVARSRGSVIPPFEQQIKTKKIVTITHPEMTRFMMKLSDAVDLILKACALSLGGEIFILKMHTVKLKTLAEAVIEHYSQRFGYMSSEIKIKIIGKRPGEKLHEELMTKEEAENAYENDEMFVIFPQILPNLEKIIEKYKKRGFVKTQRKQYSSFDQKPLSKYMIKKLFLESS